MPDFTFAWEHGASPDGPWAHLDVVRFEGTERLSALYRYEITLLCRAPADALDPHDLAGARATLRIATLTRPSYKLVHGLIVDAEEIGPVPEGMLYRVVLMPPLVRARHRTRSRIFHEKTTRAIVDAVLLGDPNLTRDDGAAVDGIGLVRTYVPAVEKLCWRIEDPTRIDDVRVRPFCVQYNESDLAFVSRLLEEEGISYHFENGACACVLVLSDTDAGKARLDPFAPLGLHAAGRHIGAVKLGARLRERKVTLGDYDWRKPSLDLAAEASSGDADLFEHRWPGGYADDKALGERLARTRLDRHRTEAEYATLAGWCRLLSAGSAFRLEHGQDRYEGEYLVTRIDVRGEQPTIAASARPEHPFACTFECARRGRGTAVAESRYRPPRVTPRPRIAGSQTAFVTDDPSARGAEIHVGGPDGAEIGCVRLRFHWDTDEQRLANEPSSCWVRVSQVFAGAGEGAVFHPRVGAEVVVEFLDGDPDRPIVTGRVYNGRNRPPGAASGAATASVMRSTSSPGGGKANEIAFHDKAGSEAMKLDAGNDMHVAVGNDHTASIAGQSLTQVGGNLTMTSESDVLQAAHGNMALSADSGLTLHGGASLHGDSPAIEFEGGATITLKAPVITVNGAGQLIASAPLVAIAGAMVVVSAPVIMLKGAHVSVAATNADVTATGTVNVKGATINLNS